MKRFFFLIGFFALIRFSYAGNPDSLVIKLTSAKNDSVRCMLLLSAGEKIYLQMPDSAERLWKEAMQIANRAISNTNSKDPAFVGYNKLLAFAYNNLAFLFSQHGDIPKTLEFYYKSLSISERLNDSYAVAILYSNIATIFRQQGDFKKSLELNFNALSLFNSIKDLKGAATCLSNIAFNYRQLGETDTAIAFYKRSLKLRYQLKDSAGIGNSLNNLGFVFNVKNLPDSALKYYLESREYFERISFTNGLAFVYNNLGMIYRIKKQLNKALEFAMKSMQLSKELKNPESISNAAKNLHQIYKAMGKYPEAFESYSLYIQMNDSISSEANKKASIKSQLKYEYEKKAAADSVKAAEEKKVVNAQLKQEKTQRLALYGGLGLVGIFALFMVNRFRVTNKQKKLIEEQKKTVEAQKHLVEEKQKEVLDSIQYARRIQTALITNEHYIKQNIVRLKK